MAIIYTAADEKEFMAALLNVGKYELAVRYGRMVLRDERRWDPTVRVAEVLAAAAILVSAAQRKITEGQGLLVGGAVSNLLAAPPIFENEFQERDGDAIHTETTEN